MLTQATLLILAQWFRNMNFKLHPYTKEAFLDIISVLDLKKAKKVFNYFIKNSSPITVKQLSELLEVEQSDAKEMALNYGEIDSNNHLIGFLGFSISKTNHSLLINNKKFYTWCAADTLIFPSILNAKAVISSTDPISGEFVNIEVEIDALKTISPTTAMISWIDEIDDCQIRGSMCNRVHFFASNKTANEWHQNNQDAKLFKVSEFYSTDIIA